MEVRQHLGKGRVRCIMLSPSEGLYRDMEVSATGTPITVPVGQANLGRLFNVLGDTIDGLDDTDALARALKEKEIEKNGKKVTKMVKLTKEENKE